jgi:hypothetical protein
MAAAILTTKVMHELGLRVDPRPVDEARDVWPPLPPAS